MVPHTTLEQKVAAAKQLVDTFRLERISYLILGIISFLVLLGLAVYTYLNDKMSWPAFAALFMPASGVTFSVSRILSMFKMCLTFIKEEVK